MDTQHPTGRALYGPSVGVGGRGGRDDGGRGGRGDGGGRGRVVRVGVCAYTCVEHVIECHMPGLGG